jgi:O-antigen/teichoic acid export membrane protein
MSMAEADSRPGVARSRNFVRGALTGVLARGAALLGPIVLLPVLLSFMGTERYGMWVAVVSLPAAALFADFGLGSGLLTQLTPVVERGDRESARHLVASAVLLLCAVALGLGLVATLVVFLIDLPTQLVPGVPRALRPDVSLVLLATTVGFLANLPLSLVHRVLMAHQMIAASNLWQAGAAAAQVAAVVLAVKLDASFGAIVCIGALVVPVVNGMLWAWFVLVRRRDLRLWSARASRGAGRSIVGLGLAFFALTAISSLALNVDQLLVAREAGLQVSTVFAVAVRLLAVPTIVVAAVSTAYWPTVGAAAAAQAWDWISRYTPSTARRTALAAGVAGAAVVLALPSVLGAWLGADAASVPDRMLLTGLVGWAVVQAAMAPWLALLSALGRVRLQAATYAGFLVVSLPIKVLVLRYGLLDALPFVNMAVYVIAFVPLLVATTRWVRSRVEQRPLNAEEEKA